MVRQVQRGKAVSPPSFSEATVQAPDNDLVLGPQPAAFGEAGESDGSGDIIVSYGDPDVAMTVIMSAVVMMTAAVVAAARQRRDRILNQTLECCHQQALLHPMRARFTISSD